MSRLLWICIGFCVVNGMFSSEPAFPPIFAGHHLVSQGIKQANYSCKHFVFTDQESLEYMATLEYV